MFDKFMNWLYDGKKPKKKAKAKKKKSSKFSPIVENIFDGFKDTIKDVADEVKDVDEDIKDTFRIGGNCQTIVQQNNRTYVNGKLVSEKGEPAKIIVEGNVTNLQCNVATIYGKIEGDAIANSINCSDVGGNIDANSVKCKFVRGNVDANTVKGI